MSGLHVDRGMLLATIALGVVVLASACSMTQSSKPNDVMDVILRDIEDVWDPSIPNEIRRLVATGDSVVSGMRAVSIEKTHQGVWRIRDRYLLENGSLVVADYEIFIGREGSPSRLMNRWVISDKEHLLTTLIGVIEAFSESSASDHSAGNSSMSHFVSGVEATGEPWMGPFFTPGLIVDRAAAGYDEARALPASAILELCVRLLDRKILPPTHEQ